MIGRFFFITIFVSGFLSSAFGVTSFSSSQVLGTDNNVPLSGGINGQKFGNLGTGVAGSYPTITGFPNRRIDSYSTAYGGDVTSFTFSNEQIILDFQGLAAGAYDVFLRWNTHPTGVLNLNEPFVQSESVDMDTAPLADATFNGFDFQRIFQFNHDGSASWELYLTSITTSNSANYDAIFVAPIPEPSHYGLLGGVALLLAVCRRCWRPKR